MSEHSFTGIYRGKVLDTNDPDQFGRIRAEVYPMLLGVATVARLKRENSNVTWTGMETVDIPWAVPAFPLFTGSGSGYGFFSVPREGTFVWVFFEGGDIYQPVYFAEAPDKVSGLPGNRVTNYPNRTIIRTESGCEITIDDTTGHIIVTGTGDVVIQGTNVRVNPPGSWA